MEFYMDCFPLFDKKGRYKYAEGYFVDSDFTYEDSEPRCHSCGRYAYYQIYKHPIHMKLSNPRFPDRVHQMASFVVSERFVERYQSSGLKGLDRFVEIDKTIVLRNKINAIPPKYYIAYPLVDPVMHIDRELSRFEYLRNPPKNLCDVCNLPGGSWHTIHHIQLQAGIKNEYDVFRIMETNNMVFYSQAFVDFIRENQLTNFWVESLETYKGGIAYSGQYNQIEIV